MSNIIDKYENKHYYIDIHDNPDTKCGMPYGWYEHNKPHTRGGGGPIKTFNEAHEYFIKQLKQNVPNPLYKDKRFRIEHSEYSPLLILIDNQGDRLMSNSYITLQKEIESRKKTMEQLSLFDRRDYF